MSMKNIERLLKESSFDCALNYDRNNQYTIDFSKLNIVNVIINVMV